MKSVVELHGGAVSVESAGVDKGTTFTVTLPVPPFVTAPERRAGLGDAGEAKGRAGRLGGLSVLVVEDEDDARDLVETVLAMEGARVHAASSAATALDALSTFNADVVVSDIAMSGHSGYWLMEHVREIRPATPGIALTAFGRGEDIERARAAGFIEHLAKPIDPERLVSAVARFGGRRAAGA